MKKIIILFAVCVVIIALTACGVNESDEVETTTDNSDNGQTGADTAETFNFRVGYLGNTDEFAGFHSAANFFAEKVNEKTGGTIQFELFPGGQLGGERDMFESIQNNTLEMGFISLAIMHAFTENFVGLQLPFLVTDYNVEFELYQSDVVREVLSTFEEMNVKGLTLFPLGLRAFGTNGKPIEKPEDFKGQIIRAPESPMLLESYNHLGMDTIPIPYPEIYTAIQTGVIEGMDQPISQWWGSKFYEVVENLSITNAYPWPAVIMINLEQFNRLSKEQQNAMIEAAEETQEFMYNKIQEIDAKALDLLIGTDTNIIQNIDHGPFKKVMEPIWEKYMAQNAYTKKIVEMVKEIESKQQGK